VIYSHVVARWIDELESTKHAQTKGALCKRDTDTDEPLGKCCLGVLAIDVLADASDPHIPANARVRRFIDDEEAYGQTFVTAADDTDNLNAQHNVLPGQIAYAVGFDSYISAHSDEVTGSVSQEACYGWNDSQSLSFSQIAQKLRERMGFTFV
jgi:hypothetical protein